MDIYRDVALVCCGDIIELMLWGHYKGTAIILWRSCGDAYKCCGDTVGTRRGKLLRCQGDDTTVATFVEMLLRCFRAWTSLL